DASDPRACDSTKVLDIRLQGDSPHSGGLMHQGGELKYTLFITNNQAFPVNDITIQEIVDTGLAFGELVSRTIVQPGDDWSSGVTVTSSGVLSPLVSQSGSTVTIQVGLMQPGEQRSYTYILEVAPTAPLGRYENAAEIFGSVLGEDLAYNGTNQVVHYIIEAGGTATAFDNGLLEVVETDPDRCGGISPCFFAEECDGEGCLDSGSTIGELPSGTVCGDANITAGEECDDGNIRDGDECSAYCQVELFTCYDESKVFGAEECPEPPAPPVIGCSIQAILENGDVDTPLKILRPFVNFDSTDGHTYNDPGAIPAGTLKTLADAAGYLRGRVILESDDTIYFADDSVARNSIGNAYGGIVELYQGGVINNIAQDSPIAGGGMELALCQAAGFRQAIIGNTESTSPSGGSIAWNGVVFSDGGGGSITTVKNLRCTNPILPSRCEEPPLTCPETYTENNIILGVSPFSHPLKAGVFASDNFKGSNGTGPLFEGATVGPHLVFGNLRVGDTITATAGGQITVAGGSSGTSYVDETIIGANGSSTYEQYLELSIVAQFADDNDNVIMLPEVGRDGFHFWNNLPLTVPSGATKLYVALADPDSSDNGIGATNTPLSFNISACQRPDFEITCSGAGTDSSWVYGNTTEPQKGYDPAKPAMTSLECLDDCKVWIQENGQPGQDYLCQRHNDANHCYDPFVGDTYGGQNSQGCFHCQVRLCTTAP
ncbi:MAG TPA: hypothetical protein VIT68_04390, partial [Candidatus Gracilibacteria bacterium]